MRKLRLLVNTFKTVLTAARYSFKFCWRNARKQTIIRLGASIGNTMAGYAVVQITGLIVNNMSHPERGPEPLLWAFGGLAGVVIVMVCLNQLEGLARSRWGQLLRMANTRELNEHRASLDLACFASKKYDDITKRIEDLSSAWQTRIWFTEEMFNLIATLISFVLFGSALLWYQPTYAAILALMAIPLFVVNFKTVAAWWRLSEEMVPHHKLRGVLTMAYHSETVFMQAKMFGQMAYLRSQIDASNQYIVAQHEKIRLASFRQKLFTGLLSAMGVVAIIAHSVWSVWNGLVPIGTFVIVLAAARTFQGNLESIARTVSEQWNNAKGVILIEREFFGLRPILQTTDPVKPTFRGPPEIEFRNVSFAYPNSPETLALKRVSFTIKPGSKVAIVGGSGHGKSTLQALMTRVYDPTQGEILVDGVNLNRIKPEDWVLYLSSLFQNYTILSRKFGEEIASSRLGQIAHPERLTASVNFANINELVELDPEGLNAQLGEEFGGREFSGGERQRVALARAYYPETPVLILDEPDAKLDPDSAETVMKNIYAEKNRTIVIITHHVSRAKRCDWIIVMGKGEVVEQGTHDELMTRNGAYARMFRKDSERLGHVE